MFATQQRLAQHLLPRFIAGLQHRYPHVQPVIRIATTDVVKRWLELSDVEFALSVNNVSQDSLVSCVGVTDWILSVVDRAFAFAHAVRQKNRRSQQTGDSSLRSG